MASTNLLPAASTIARLPYVASRLLGDLGPSPTALTERNLKKLHKSFPIPGEQEVLWADAAFGTRSHGLALTDAGIFFKDGPADDDEDEGDGDDLGDEPANPLEPVGAGYHYVRWQNFDPAVIGHEGDVPTIGGVPFTDAQRFVDVANACIRIKNRRTLMARAGKKALAAANAELAASDPEAPVVLGPGTPVRSVYRPTAAATFARCFDDEGFYDLVGDDGAPHLLEVPADQYDAVLQRMRKKIAGGWVEGLDDPDEAAVLVRKGAFTRAQAVNVVRTLRPAEASYRPNTDGIVCRDPRGLSFVLRRHLELRDRAAAAAYARLTGDAASAAAGGSAAGAPGLSGVSAQAMASGAALAENPQKAAQANVANMLTSNVSSMAGQRVGSIGARVLTGALGVTCAPVALAASFVLGNACSKAGGEAFAMARDLLVEPQAHIAARLFNSVLANVTFEYALTASEQLVLGALMQRVDPAVYQRLGAAVSEAPGQEDELRAFLTPLCEAVRAGRVAVRKGTR